MKNHIRLLIILLSLGVGTNAQISTPAGYLHGTYKKGDTVIDYHADPKKDNHPEVTVIKKTKDYPGSPYDKNTTAHHGGKADSTAPKPDTAATAATDTGQAVPVDQAPVINISSGSTCDCINSRFIYGGLLLLGLGFLFDLYLLAQTMRDRVRPAFASALHGMLAAAGMTLLIVYYEFQKMPIFGLALLGLAILLGLILLYNDSTGKKSSKALVIVQAVIALVGVGLILAFAVGY